MVLIKYIPRYMEEGGRGKEGRGGPATQMELDPIFEYYTHEHRALI